METGNYPNPFNAQIGSTTIVYRLRENMDVNLEFFSYLGNRLLSRHFNPGEEGGRLGVNRVVWDGRDSRGIIVGSGGYICRITCTSPTDNKKSVVTRKIGVVRE